MLAFVHVCNKHFATYEIIQVIKHMQNLLECYGSRDALLNFQNKSNISRSKTIIMNRIMDTTFELQYKVVAELY